MWTVGCFPLRSQDSLLPSTQNNSSLLWLSPPPSRLYQTAFTCPFAANICYMMSGSGSQITKASSAIAKNFTLRFPIFAFDCILSGSATWLYSSASVLAVRLLVCLLVCPLAGSIGGYKYLLQASLQYLSLPHPVLHILPSAWFFFRLPSFLSSQFFSVLRKTSGLDKR